MKLLGNGWSTAEATLAGTTAALGGATTVTGTYAPGPGGLRVQKIIAITGGSTVTPNTSGGLHFRYGDSSDAIFTTLVVLPMTCNGAGSTAVPLSPMVVTLDGLDIKCNWFEAASQEAAIGGWSIFVFGE